MESKSKASGEYRNDAGDCNGKGFPKEADDLIYSLQLDNHILLILTFIAVFSTAIATFATGFIMGAVTRGLVFGNLVVEHADVKREENHE